MQEKLENGLLSIQFPWLSTLDSQLLSLKSAVGYRAVGRSENSRGAISNPRPFDLFLSKMVSAYLRNPLPPPVSDGPGLSF